MNMIQFQRLIEGLIARGYKLDFLSYGFISVNASISDIKRIKKELDIK